MDSRRMRTRCSSRRLLVPGGGGGSAPGPRCLVLVLGVSVAGAGGVSGGRGVVYSWSGGSLWLVQGLPNRDPPCGQNDTEV